MRKDFNPWYLLVSHHGMLPSLLPQQIKWNGSAWSLHSSSRVCVCLDPSNPHPSTHHPTLNPSINYPFIQLSVHPSIHPIIYSSSYFIILLLRHISNSHTISHFKKKKGIHILLVFNIVLKLVNHHHYPFPEHFIIPPKSPLWTHIPNCPKI